MEEKIKAIVKQIRTLENGIIAADMERNGLKYHRNFGVSIVHLRQLATRYGSDQQLAEALWDKNWRETKILASLIADENEISEQVLQQWIWDCSTSELVEQLSLNFLVKLPDALEVVHTQFKQETDTTVAVAATTLAHLLFKRKEIPLTEFESFLRTLVKFAGQATPFTKRSLALALRRLGRQGLELNKKVVAEMNELKANSGSNVNWIVEDVLVELTDEYIVAGLK